MDFQNLKIIELRAENLKRLVAVEIRPDGNLVEITGKNGQGKSSVLDAIWMAIAGADAIPGVPIRKGENEAIIELDLGPIKITRTFREREPSKSDPKTWATALRLESPEGALYPQPQTILDKLIGALSFDPLAFTRMTAAQQFEALRMFVPEVDFPHLKRLLDGDMARRRDINRDAKAARTRGEAIRVASVIPMPVDLDALQDEMQAATQHNADIEVRRIRRESTVADTNRLTSEIADVGRLIDEMQERIRTMTVTRQEKADQLATLTKLLADAPPLPAPRNTSEWAQKIAEGRTHNANVERLLNDKKERDRLLAEAAEKEAESDAITAEMQKREDDKFAAIAAAKLPVPGLGFGDDEITLNGVPFDQASSAEKIRTSVAVAMAMNSGLRVIRVQDGSLLDSEAMTVLSEMAGASDFQVWVETVDAGGRPAVEIRDGAVVGQELAPREPKKRAARAKGGEEAPQPTAAAPQTAAAREPTDTTPRNLFGA